MELLPFNNRILSVAGNVPNMDLFMGSTRVNQGNKESPRKNFLDLGVI